MFLNTLDDVGSKFAEFAAGSDGAFYLIPTSTMQVWRPTIMSMALENRLVTGCLQDRQWAVAGCLVTCTEDGEAIFRSAAGMVAKVPRGAKPADIPVEQPTSFELIIDTKTAKALDLTVPLALLAAADEVIE